MPAKGKKTQVKSKNPIQKMAISASKNAAVPQKLKAIKKKVSRIEPTDIAKGAAAISIAAGMIAAGAALMDKENRRKAGKMAGKGMDFIQGMADDAGGKYQAVAQSVPFKRGSSKKQSTKGRSKR